MTMPTCSTGIQSVSLKPATDIAAASRRRRGAQLYCAGALAASAFRLGCGRVSEVAVETAGNGGELYYRSKLDKSSLWARAAVRRPRLHRVAVNGLKLRESRFFHWQNGFRGMIRRDNRLSRRALTLTRRRRGGARQDTSSIGLLVESRRGGRAGRSSYAHEACRGRRSGREARSSNG